MEGGWVRYSGGMVEVHIYRLQIILELFHRVSAPDLRSEQTDLV